MGSAGRGDPVWKRKKLGHRVNFRESFPVQPRWVFVPKRPFTRIRVHRVNAAYLQTYLHSRRRYETRRQPRSTYFYSFVFCFSLFLTIYTIFFFASFSIICRQSILGFIRICVFSKKVRICEIS